MSCLTEVHSGSDTVQSLIPTSLVENANGKYLIYFL